ncbi:MAG: pitrilysin family protein [Chloroflexia bacterium]
MIAIETEKAGADYELTVLPNGLRVITSPMPHTRSAAVQFYVGVGARHERPALSGISHFVEHMVFKGTERRPNPVQISEAIEGVGGNLNACTDHEHTSYRALVPHGYLGTAVDVLTDILRYPRFTEDDIKKERAVIIEEISSTYDSPGEIVDLVFDGLLWPDNPIGEDVAGTKKTVKRIARADLVEHIERHYTPDSIVVSVAGNVTHSQVVEEIERRWVDLPGGVHKSQAIPTSPVPAPAGPHFTVYKKRTEQTNMVVGVPALPYTHPRRYVQDVLDSLLGGGMSSRLFVELRENLGLAYSVSSFVKSFDDVGAFGVHAAVDNDMALLALSAIMSELRRIRDEAVSETELRKVKEYIKGHTLLGLERSSYVAFWAGWQELMLNRIDSVEEALERVEAVSANDIRQLAEELFTTKNLHMALVGPANKQDGLHSALNLD